VTPGRNLLAGLGNSAWSALVNLAVVPLYLHYLGIEAYGLIGFFITIQALLSLLDMGMAPTINREVARCSASGNMAEAGRLLHTLAAIYWVMTAVIALLFLVLAPLIAGHWLQPKELAPETISQAVMLMGLVIACRWPVGLYQGALIGAQRLTVSSAINAAMVTLGALGALAVLAFVSPTIQAFFIWQASLGALHALVIRFAAWRVIGRSSAKVFDVDKLKSTWRFAAGMSGIALTSVIFTQLDKLIISKLAGLETFGYYMLATAIVSAMYVLVNPVFNVIYPRMTALVASEETAELSGLYRTGTRILASVILPIGVTLAVFSRELVLIWTNNPEVTQHVSPVISVLALGSALHGIMYFPYALQLAHGMTLLPLVINLCLMLALVPLLIFLVTKYGAIGGAWAWLVLHSMYVLVGSWLTHHYLLKKLLASWLLLDVGIPLVIACLLGLLGYFFTSNIQASAYVKLASGCAMGLSTSVLLLLIPAQTRKVIFEFLGK